VSNLSAIKYTYDISLILNLHDEARFLRRTMMSIIEAVQYARGQKISIELVVVLDKPDQATKSWVTSNSFQEFDGYKIVTVNNGSLGLSRRDGVSHASGEFIATCDADDLVSYNMFSELYFSAKSTNRPAVVVPQYLYAFGDKFHLVEYFGTDKVSKLAFFSGHPYISRIFASAELFAKISYVDAAVASGFAYEDWHFNCEALSLGWEFISAKDTVFFYRQRPNSLLQLSNERSTKQTPYSSYFDPVNYLRVCTSHYSYWVDGEIYSKQPEEVRERFRNNAVCIELLHAASSIEPAIDYAKLNNVTAFTNLDIPARAGAAYFRLCKQLNGNNFTDVVLLPFVTTGGGEKYILDVLNGIAELEPERNFLILTGERIVQHSWLDKLPPNSLFIDLYRACEGMGSEVIELMTLRVIQSVAPQARIFLKSSTYAVSFFKKYAKVLIQHHIVYFRFLDPVTFERGHLWTSGFDFDFLSEYGSHFELILTDNETIAARDRNLLDTLAPKIRCLYAHTDILPDEELNLARKPTGRLLWASRLDLQKRPHLIIAIARRLASRNVKVKIDVYGDAILDKFNVVELKKSDVISYKGPFSSFEELQPAKYDGFLYTSAFDGLPNVLLEALASGLTPIAANVGGIAELITAENGFLIDDFDEDKLIDGYVDAICQLYADKEAVNKLRISGLKLVRERHSKRVFLEKLRDIFDIGEIRRPAC